MAEFDWSVIREYSWYVAQGVPVTLLISGGGILLGLIFGVAIAFGLISRIRVLRWVLRAYVEVFRNTPVLVQIVWFYYVIPIVTGLELGPMQAGVLALGLNASAYIAEIVRGGIVGMPAGQTEAARSLGLSHWGAMRRVILPQAGRRMIAPLANMFVVLIKESALVSYIGVLEILHRGDVVQVETFKPLEAYTLVAVYYFIVITVITTLLRRLERKLVVVE
jgi:polar amino acid transport system permease protein